MKKMEKSSEDSVVIITHQEPGNSDTGTGTGYCNKYETVASRRKLACLASVLAFEDEPVSLVTPQEDDFRTRCKFCSGNPRF